MGEKAIVVSNAEVPMLTALPVAAIRTRVEKIEEIKREVMREGIHYGVIPGCQRPSLLQAGAELLMMAFQLSVGEVTVEDLSGPDEARYRYTMEIITANGTLVGVGVGEASSSEEKFKWRYTVCDDEWENTQRDRRRIKYTKEGDQIRQVRTDVATEAHKVGQFAYKRAFVRAARTVLAASHIFTQDIEDGDFNGNGKPRSGRRKPTVNTATSTYEGSVKKVTEKGTSTGGTIYTLIMDDGEKFGTFSETIGGDAKGYAGTGQVVRIGYTQDKYGKKAQSLEPVEQPPPVDGDQSDIPF